MANSLLWRGGITASSEFEKKLERDFYLFESCRSAIYSFSIFNISEGRSIVYVASFTCDAVIDALRDSGAHIRFYELDIDFNVQVNGIVESSSAPEKEWVLWQCTMGHLGDRGGSIKMLRDRGMLVVGDLALSFGSMVERKPYVELFDGAFVSFECSKLLSAGWGGGFYFRSESFNEYYILLNSVSSFSSLLRYIQERFCFYYNSRFDCNSFVYAMFDTIRKALTAVSLFRRSAESNKPANIGRKIGFLQERCVSQLTQELESHRRSEVSKAYLKVYESAKKFGVITPNTREQVTYCTPRFPFFVEQEKVNEVVECSKSLGISVGEWFHNNNTFADLSFVFDEKRYVCMNLSLIGADGHTLNRYADLFHKITRSAK